MNGLEFACAFGWEWMCINWIFMKVFGYGKEKGEQSITVHGFIPRHDRVELKGIDS